MVFLRSVWPSGCGISQVKHWVGGGGGGGASILALEVVGFAMRGSKADELRGPTLTSERLPVASDLLEPHLRNLAASNGA